VFGVDEQDAGADRLGCVEAAQEHVLQQRAAEAEVGCADPDASWTSPAATTQ